MIHDLRASSPSEMPAPLETGTSTFVAVERQAMQRLRSVATRLYAERRMNGDEMRDLAHAITAVLDQAIDMPESACQDRVDEGGEDA
jgi:hypothetical protein